MNHPLKLLDGKLQFFIKPPKKGESDRHKEKKRTRTPKSPESKCRDDLDAMDGRTLSSTRSPLQPSV